MSLTGKTKANTYKDLLEIDNSNSGIATSLKVIKSGSGDETCLYVSDDQIKIKPENDDTTAVLDVQDKDGNTKLLVDTTNDYVKALGHHANTQIQSFGLHGVDATAGGHQALVVGGGSFMDAPTYTEKSLGTGSDPATTLDVSGDTAYQWLQHFWYVPANITVDSVHLLFSNEDSSGGHSMNFHVMSYAMSTSGGSYGDLSDGTVVADDSATTSVLNSEIRYKTLTVQSADVASGRVIVATVETDQTDDVYVNMQLKYHFK